MNQDKQTAPTKKKSKKNLYVTCTCSPTHIHVISVKKHCTSSSFHACTFYIFGWALKHFGEQNSQRFPQVFQTTLLNLPNWRLHVHGELHDLCWITPVGGLGQKIKTHWPLHFRKMMFDQLPYKDLTQQYGSDCWLGKDF